MSRVNWTFSGEKKSLGKLLALLILTKIANEKSCEIKKHNFTVCEQIF